MLAHRHEFRGRDRQLGWNLVDRKQVMSIDWGHARLSAGLGPKRQGKGPPIPFGHKTIPWFGIPEPDVGIVDQVVLRIVRRGEIDPLGVAGAMGLGRRDEGIGPVHVVVGRAAREQGRRQFRTETHASQQCGVAGAAGVHPVSGPRSDQRTGKLHGSARLPVSRICQNRSAPSQPLQHGGSNRGLGIGQRDRFLEDRGPVEVRQVAAGPGLHRADRLVRHDIEQRLKDGILLLGIIDFHLAGISGRSSTGCCCDKRWPDWTPPPTPTRSPCRWK